MRSIGFLAYPGFQLHHASGAICAFEMADSYCNELYQSFLLSEKGGPVATSSGIEVSARPFEAADDLDTLFIPGGRGWREASMRQPVLAFIREQAACVRRIATVASGAGVLLASGGERPARIAAHWARARELAGHYPGIEVTSDEQLVVDHGIWSTPSTRGAVEIARAMIAEDHDDKTARRATLDLLMLYRRPASPDGPRDGECRFHQLLGWARCNLQHIVSINDLADCLAMPPTQFVPAFAAATGMTPAKAVERLRLEAALELIETSGQPLAEVAKLVGFQNSERMRRAFIRAFGQPPNAVRAVRNGDVERVEGLRESVLLPD